MSQLFSLEGRRAVVTGGGSGIGLAMATALAEAGARVSIWGRSLERLERARDAAAPTAELVVQQVDVADEQAVVAGIAEAVELLGGLDTLVVNAGKGGRQAPFLDSVTEDLHEVVGTNLDGAYWTMREGARAMRDGGGSIIAIASLAAIEGAGRNQQYGATKGAVLALANGAAVELARHGIRVNTVLPGWIATDMTTGAQESAAFEQHVIPRIPARRWGAPEDFAGIAVYLASDASRYQTGSTIVIDGGYAIF